MLKKIKHNLVSIVSLRDLALVLIPLLVLSIVPNQLCIFTSLHIARAVLQPPQINSTNLNSNVNNTNSLNSMSLPIPPPQLNTIPYELNMTAQDSLLPNLYNTTQGSVVSIAAHVMSSNSTDENASEADGSGFIYDSDGHIITNNHVVEGANSFDVTLGNGNSYSAFVVGKDLYSDLAVLQLDPSALQFEHLLPLPVLNSSSLRVGQHVVAIGNPLGLYSGSMTEGIVSQTNRVIFDNGFYSYGLIQFDAPISPGNSGGPLLNLDGQVVGVTTGASANPNATLINFAIASNTVLRVVPELITHHIYRHPWIGISGDDITPELAKTIGLSQSRGFFIVDIAPGSPAALAGLQKLTDTNTPDIILGVDKIPVRRLGDMLNYIDTKSVGDKLVLRILRNGSIQDINIQLAERPQISNSSSSANQFSKH